MRMFPDENKRLRNPRMPKVGYDHPELWKFDNDIFQLYGKGIFERSSSDKRSSLVNHDGQFMRLTKRIYLHHARISRMNVLVDWTEFYASQLQAHDFVEGVVNGINSGINGTV